MTKRDVLHDIGTILLVWIGALTLIFILPDVQVTQKYLLASVATALTVVAFPLYYGWEKISGLPKTRFQQIAFGGQTLFFFYIGYLFWSLVESLWQVPPVVNGSYVVTWFALFLILVLAVGAYSFYMGIRNLALLAQSLRNP